MLLRLERCDGQGEAMMGRLLINGHVVYDTLEPRDKMIPTGYYRVRMTMSTKFGEVLPLLDFVPGRSGIRIHPGNTAKDSAGCILVGVRSPKAVSPSDTSPRGDYVEPRLYKSRKTFDALREQLLAAAREREEIGIEIVDATRRRREMDRGYDKATVGMTETIAYVPIYGKRDGGFESSQEVEEIMIK